MNNDKVAIVTITYNAEDVLEETILSIINQSYKNIEYIVIDGASTDGTIDIIKKYEDKINYWISEPNEGIYFAMNKAIEKATGEWINFMNAGDTFVDIYSPWPEEANRQLTTQITAYHFAPTETSKSNLLKENVNERSIEVTGNTVIDALFLALEKIKSNKQLETDITNHLATLDYELKSDKKIILVTGHRRENHGQGFINICTALKEIALANPNIDIVYPVHLNPNVQKPVKELLSGIDNVYLIEPLQYEQFIYMMDKSTFIITDSGGVQEEAPSLGKPVLVMRDTTERPEALDAGTVKLVGTNTQLIINEAQKLLDDTNAYDKMSQASNPYGDGHACEKVINYLMKCE